MLGLLVLYAISSGPRAYGLMSDEYYYLDCASHLAWGYVDHPPLSIAILALVKATLGTSTLALRLVPALMVCLNVVLVALLARELSGGRVAQSLAALGAATAPVYLAVMGFYSMNAFEPAIWSGAALLLARIARGGEPRLWLALGVLLGLGLLNKLSVLWLGLGLAVGLVATRQRRWLATPWPYACAAIALAIASPYVRWEWQHAWPTLEFARNARELKMAPKSALGFALDQLLVMSPATVPLWLAGLGYYASRAGASQRWLGWIWLSVIVLLMASGTARANYAAPAYSVLLAAGGVALERFARHGVRRLVPALLAVAMLGVGVGAAPLAVPLLPPLDLVRYIGAIGISAPRDERASSGLLPEHFALRFGWDDLALAVEQASETLSPGERLRAVVFAPTFGAAGSLDFRARALGLPPVVSGHNNYWLWGPGDTDGEVVIAVAEDAARLERIFRDVREVARVHCDYCVPEVARYRVYVCRGLRRPLEEVWRELKHFV